MGQDNAYAHGIVENVFRGSQDCEGSSVATPQGCGSADPIQDSVIELLPLKLGMLQKNNICPLDSGGSHEGRRKRILSCGLHGLKRSRRNREHLCVPHKKDALGSTPVSTNLKPR